MSTKLYPIKGSVSWNKSSGIVQSGGLVPPDVGMDSISVGDEVVLQFKIRVKSASGSSSTHIATTPVLKLFDWRCVPNGWIYSAHSEVDKNIKGEYVSIFQCLHEYKTSILNLDIEGALDSLTIYDQSHIRATSSPYASNTSGWWNLSDITSWAIPNLANISLSTLSLTEYTSDIQILRSQIPLINQLFWMDGFSKTVSMIGNIPVVDTMGNTVSVSPYLDLTTVDHVDLMGSKGDPSLDFRQDGAGQLEFVAEVEGNSDAFSVQVREKMSTGVWFTEATKSTQAFVKKIYSQLTEPIEMPERVKNYVIDVLLDKEQSTNYEIVSRICTANSTRYFDAYMANAAVLQQTKYYFNRARHDVTPMSHVSPVLVESLSVNTTEDDGVAQAVSTDFGGTAIKLDSFYYDVWVDYPWDVESSSLLGTAATYFDNKRYIAAKASLTQYDIRPLCTGSTNNNTDPVPYLFYRPSKVTYNMQAGLFLLNLSSQFWITPEAETNLAAKDPAGNRVWMGPYDNPVDYGMKASGILSLAQMLSESTDIMGEICTFSQHSYIFHESDVVVAAILNDLEKDSPYAYRRDFDQYYKVVKQWAGGQLYNLNGLQYSYIQAHKGLAEAIAGLAKKQGETITDEILSRILPGSRLADINDAAGTSYCKDMLEWMVEHGVARMAGGDPVVDVFADDEEEEDGKQMVRNSPALIESKSETFYGGGVIRTINTNMITGDREISEIPTNANPELMYVSPRYVQLSTAEKDTTGSIKILGTKVMQWDRIQRLQEEYNSRLVGKELVMASYNSDYTDNPAGARSELSDNMSDPTVRSTKLSVSGEGSVFVTKSQISELK